MINPKLLNWDELGMVHCWIYYIIQPGMSSLGNAKLGPPHKIPSDGNIETPDVPTANIYIYMYILYAHIYNMAQFFESQEISEIERTLTQLFYVTQTMWSPWGKVACGLNHLMRRTSTCVFVQKQTQ